MVVQDSPKPGNLATAGYVLRRRERFWRAIGNLLRSLLHGGLARRGRDRDPGANRRPWGRRASPVWAEGDPERERRDGCNRDESPAPARPRRNRRCC